MELICLCNIYEWFTDRENVKDFIWPSIITISTIFFSVFLSKNEFERQNKNDKSKKLEDNIRLKNIIIRNSKIISEKTIEESDRFIQLLKSNYNFEKGCVPRSIILTLPELDILNSIEPLKMEEIFSPSSDELSDFYLATAAIKQVDKTYQLCINEFEAINNHLSAFDTVIMEKYLSFLHLINCRIQDYLKTESKNSDIFNSYYSIDYNSNVNNYTELQVNIMNIAKDDNITHLFKDDSMLLEEKINSFMIYYLKLQQLVFLFSTRVSYLSNRLNHYGVQLSYFSNH